MLFPDALPGQQLIREKNTVQYFSLPAKSVLNTCNSCRLPNAVTLNPYRGCEFGCSYCYARYTHEYMNLNWEDFENRIFVKTSAPRILLRTLDCEKLHGKHIAIGTATDPYQPAEARFLVTRKLLEVFSQVKGLTISITTKSALFRRDLDLFLRIAEHNRIRINLSLISLNARLLRLLEPKASGPQSRLMSLKSVSDAGISTAVFIMPILPGLTDGLKTLEAVVRAAREHGARDIHSRVLFLRDSAKRALYAFLERHDPRLFCRYKAIFSKRTYTEQQYQQKILCIIDNLKAKYGYDSVPDEDFRLDRVSHLEETPGLFEGPDLTEGPEC